MPIEPAAGFHGNAALLAAEGSAYPWPRLDEPVEPLNGKRPIPDELATDMGGELPERALSASIPVSAEAGSAPLRLAGNRVAYLLTALPTHVANQVLRVRAVREVTAEAKLELELGGRELTLEGMEHLPPLLYTWLRRRHAPLRLADSLPPPSNLVVSNVPGPRETLYWSGAKLVELYSIGPISEGIGLNFTVWSYRDALHVAALACREQVPDLPEIVASFEAELAQLEAAAGASAPAD